MGSFWFILGLGSVIFALFKFLKQLGVSIPIIELMLLIAGLQWIIGPIIEYSTSYEHYKYYMYVDENSYMSYTVPAYILYLMAALKIKPIGFEKIESKLLNRQYLMKWGWGIFFIGILAEIFKSSVPSSLSFLFYILINFKYIGVITLFFSGEKKFYYVFFFAILYLFYSSLVTGFFHEFILWSAFFFFMWAAKNKPTFTTKLAIISVGIVLATTIQAVKSNYRLSLKSGGQEGGFALFFDVFKDEVAHGNLKTIDASSELNIRLNQGWIISAILNHTPYNEPFAEGETIINAVSASILPRFLNPYKSKAGGQENFSKYTGLTLGGSTSMGMSILGEAYANFGREGGILFMGIWGVFLAWFWNLIEKLCSKNLLYIFFLPLLFLQVVKAETELVVVLNHLIKSGIVIFIMFRLFVGDDIESTKLEVLNSN